MPVQCHYRYPNPITCLSVITGGCTSEIESEHRWATHHVLFHPVFPGFSPITHPLSSDTLTLASSEGPVLWASWIPPPNHLLCLQVSPFAQHLDSLTGTPACESPVVANNRWPTSSYSVHKAYISLAFPPRPSRSCTTSSRDSKTSCYCLSVPQ